MRSTLFVLFLVHGVLAAQTTQPRDAQERVASANTAVAGRWVVTSELIGRDEAFFLSTHDVFSQPVEGSR